MRARVCLLILLSLPAGAQIDDRVQSQKASNPVELDLPKLFEQKELSREEFDEIQQRNEQKIIERLNQAEALETPIDPEQYQIGPGDVFAFRVWGPMEQKKYIVVSPEGILSIPSVGEITVKGKSLKELQASVDSLAAAYFLNSKISLTLESLRFFRVHVVGEVKRPGAFLAQATDRVSDLIEMAGGVTNYAWKQRVELRRTNGNVDTVDLDSYYLKGSLQSNPFLSGGDVIFVRPIDFNEDYVRVEGNLKIGGYYPIAKNEDLYRFCLRIRALENNVETKKISVLRNTEREKGEIIFVPFADSLRSFRLDPGDVVVLPLKHVYVKGAVRNPGAYPFLIGYTAKDYVGLAGGDYQSGGIGSVIVYRAASGKTDRGPNQIVSDGDVVDLPQSMANRYQNYMSVISAIASLIIAAKAVGFLGNN
jgi:protein involved in polysaccharide export with SLBB domain